MIFGCNLQNKSERICKFAVILPVWNSDYRVFSIMNWRGQVTNNVGNALSNNVSSKFTITVVRFVFAFLNMYL